MLLQLVLWTCVTLVALPEARATDLRVDVLTDGTYSIVVDGITWLRSSPTFFNVDSVTWRTGDSVRELVLKIFDSNSSPAWNETKITYNFGQQQKVMTSIKSYHFEKKIIFTQTYVTGASNTSLNGQSSYNAIIAGFPSFQVTDGDEDLGFLSYGGYMLGYTDLTTGRFNKQTTAINDGMNSGPLAIFNSDGKAVVISPYDNFMAASMWFDSGHIAWGIMGGVNNIPVNFTYRTILQFGDGINKAFSMWGESLRSKTDPKINSKKEDCINNDFTLNYLGYWTDKGAYYYYKTEPNKTYEATMQDVNFHSDTDGIPYRYLQLDSWWYPKENQKLGVTSWTAMSDVFPHGLKALSDGTKWKFAAHNRLWSKLTPYAKQNNGSYEFVVEDTAALPDSIEFWRFLLKQAKDWGLVMYEQDWLNKQTLYLSALQTSLTLGTDWLTQMGQAAAENNLTIQYCMAMSRHALQSIEIPAVTQARVSHDFLYQRPGLVAQPVQWKIGVTSIFANALNLRPYKDTFWTTSNQPGNRYNRTVKYPALEAVVSSLSRGPVGPGDMIGGTNKTLLMRCCTVSGKLLRPSRPALAIDKQIIKDAFKVSSGTNTGEIWTTVSYIPGIVEDTYNVYGILFAADISGTISVDLQDLHFETLSDGVYYPYDDVTQWKYFNSTTKINLAGCTMAKFCLYYFSPFMALSPVKAILGEYSKWIPMSNDRIESITHDQTGVVLNMLGEPDEHVTFWFLVDEQLKNTTCYFDYSTNSCFLYVIPDKESTTTGPGTSVAASVTTARHLYIYFLLTFVAHKYTK